VGLTDPSLPEPPAIVSNTLRLSRAHWCRTLLRPRAVTPPIPASGSAHRPRHGSRFRPGTGAQNASRSRLRTASLAPTGLTPSTTTNATILRIRSSIRVSTSSSTINNNRSCRASSAPRSILALRPNGPAKATAVQPPAPSARSARSDSGATDHSPRTSRRWGTSTAREGIGRHRPPSPGPRRG
jgi:hypothetical protein